MGNLDKLLAHSRLPIHLRTTTTRQEVARLAFVAMKGNNEACTSFTSLKKKINEQNREYENREITNITKPGEYAFYIAPNGIEISVQKTQNNDFEQEFNEILEQIASVLEMEDFELSNYFPEIINNDSSKTNPKRATASYVQKVFQLLFFKMYGVNIMPDNHTSNETKTKRDAGLFLSEKFGRKSFQTCFPRKLKEAEKRYFQQPKNKR